MVRGKGKLCTNVRKGGEVLYTVYEFETRVVESVCKPPSPSKIASDFDNYNPTALSGQ